MVLIRSILERAVLKVLFSLSATQSLHDREVTNKHFLKLQSPNEKTYTEVRISEHRTSAWRIKPKSTEVY